MLIDEDRLRELYAAGEIDLDQLERSLDIINRRRDVAENRAPSTRALEPMPEDQRAVKLDEIMARPAPRRRPPAVKCPSCRSEAREVVEHGVQTAWCPSCQTYVGPDPRASLVEPDCHPRGGFVGGVLIYDPDGFDLF